MYLLGDGYFSELYLRYKNKYHSEIIEEKDFQDYLRELIYQEICIEIKPRKRKRCSQLSNQKI